MLKIETTGMGSLKDELLPEKNNWITVFSRFSQKEWKVKGMVLELQ